MTQKLTGTDGSGGKGTTTMEQTDLPAAPEVDLDEARYFLHLLDPEGVFTFQTFDDRKGERDPSLIRVLHGSLDQHAQQLQDLNDRGAGIFVMVNQGDGQIRPGGKTCRTNSNVIAVRALFVDLDGSPLEPVLQAAVTPSIVIESSPGRWHAYWPIRGCPLDAFSDTQRALATKFQGDEAVVDLARVMRLPGFLHRKAEPFLTRIITPNKTGRES